MDKEEKEYIQIQRCYYKTNFFIFMLIYESMFMH